MAGPSAERDPRYNHQLREDAKRLYVDEHLSLRQVAERLDKSPRRIYDVLKEQGITLRGTHGE